MRHWKKTIHQIHFLQVLLKCRTIIGIFVMPTKEVNEKNENTFWHSQSSRQKYSQTWKNVSPNSQVSQISCGRRKEVLKLPPAIEQPPSVLARGINCSFSKEQWYESRWPCWRSILPCPCRLDLTGTRQGRLEDVSFKVWHGTTVF